MNHNKTEEKNTIKSDIIEYLLKILIEYEIITNYFIKNNFPSYKKLYLEISSPLSKKQKYLKSLENSLILEDSLESIQYIEEDPEKFLNISNDRYLHYNEHPKIEFSSYTSNNINDCSSLLLTRNSSLTKINSLEARLDHLNVTIVAPKINFKQYIMKSENAILKKKIMIRKKKKNLWKSSF